jgi:alpha/beta superfamily hydrolase
LVNYSAAAQHAECDGGTMPDVVLTGGAGRIEGKYNPGKTANAPVALILPPHPKGGGNMDFPVVAQLHLLFMRRGFSTLRFNFRGVGRSQGEYDSGIGELSDAATALDWLQTTNPTASQCWIAGYSFGAYIGMQLLMRRPETDGFITVSAPANMYDFSFLAPCPASGLFLHGVDDTVTPPVEVDRVVAKLRTQKGIVIDYDLIEGASHFWQGHMPEVAKHVGDYLDKRLEADPI